MSKKDEFAWMDATEQAELVRTKQVKPIELVEAAIERIEKLNPQLNAVITPMYDLAREAAEKPVQDSVFAGVPFLMKGISSNLFYRGFFASQGISRSSWRTGEVKMGQGISFPVFRNSKRSLLPKEERIK